MKTKNNVFVKIANKKEAKNAKRILEALGEEVYSGYWIDDLDANQDHLIFRKHQNWVLVENFHPDGHKTEVTLKELIQIIVGEQEEVKELEVGKWYKNKNYLNSIVFKADEVGGYGFWEDSWSSGWLCNDPHHWGLATDEEVLEALSKEAVKRGFKEGVTVNNHQGKNKLPHFDLKNIKSGCFGEGIYYHDDKSGIWLCYKGKWAEIIEEPKSILYGAVAVSFSNQKQLEAICKYNKVKLRVSFEDISKNYGYQPYATLQSYWSFCDKKYYTNAGYKCISFEEFAKEAGIQVPKLMGKTEDGVDLYLGDEYYHVWFHDFYETNKWDLLRATPYVLSHDGFLSTPTDKVFASKEKAIEWCEKANRPKEKFYAIMRNAGNNLYPTEIFDTEKELNEAVNKISKRDNSKLIASKSILITN